MSEKDFLVGDMVPLPPPDAEVFTTACDYCVVACGYKVYRWPVGKMGGARAHQNALGMDFPLAPLKGGWISPNQHNVVSVNGKPHHVVVIADHDTRVVNVGGDHSIRGGTIAKKCYNPTTDTADRLKYPLLRVDGELQRISWDDVLDIMVAVSKHILRKHGKEAWALKCYSYQFWENTYAITKLALRHIRTAAFAVHDQPTGHGSDTPGLSDAGLDPFAAAYEDWMSADALFMSGSDPFESKTIIFNEWIMKGIQRGMKVISVVPRKTAGVAYGERNGGLYLEIIPGTDAVLHMALSRYIIEQGWEDREFLDRFVNNRTEVELEVFQADGFEDFSRWIRSYKYAELDRAAEITGIPAEKIRQAAEMLAKPNPDGSRKKASFGFEKGNYWSNNYLNTASLASLGLICGAGNRPGQVISRFGGHQRGMMPGGRYPIEDAPEKFPNRQKKAIDLDRWVEDGRTRFAWVIGTTWLQAMTASQRLRDSLMRMTRENPHQIQRRDKRHAIDVLIKRVDSGGMLVVDQDIYPIHPIGTEIADIVLPAAGWGEENFSRANGERRIRFYSKFYDPPGEARPDWAIIADFGRRMGFRGFDWKNSNEIFEEAAWWGRNRRTSYWALVWYARHKKEMSGHEYLASLGTTGIQAPVRYEEGRLVGTVRLHDAALKPGTQYGLTGNAHQWLTDFRTPTGRANLLKTPWEIFADFYEFMKPVGDELWVTSGRINEFWQSGFDDQQRRPYLRQRWPENFVEIHPVDAAARGIESGDRVVITCDRVPVQVGGFDHSDEARAGVVRLPELTSLPEEPDSIVQAIASPRDRRRRGTENLTPMTAEIQGDGLLAFAGPRDAGDHRQNGRPAAEPGSTEPDPWSDPGNGEPHDQDLQSDDNLGESSALGLRWSDIKPMLFSELYKNGHIELTSANYEAIAMVTDAIRPGVAFTYFLVPGSAANSLAPRVLDPVSQRYRFKLARGVVRKIGESEYKHDFRTMTFKSRAIV
jgi:arsenite oxidase large subunit